MDDMQRCFYLQVFWYVQIKAVLKEGRIQRCKWVVMVIGIVSQVLIQSQVLSGHCVFHGERRDVLRKFAHIR